MKHYEAAVGDPESRLGRQLCSDKWKRHWISVQGPKGNISKGSEVLGCAIYSEYYIAG